MASRATRPTTTASSPPTPAGVSQRRQPHLPHRARPAAARCEPDHRARHHVARRAHDHDRRPQRPRTSVRIEYGRTTSYGAFSAPSAPGPVTAASRSRSRSAVCGRTPATTTARWPRTRGHDAQPRPLVRDVARADRHLDRADPEPRDLERQHLRDRPHRRHGRRRHAGRARAPGLALPPPTSARSATRGRRAATAPSASTCPRSS